MTQTYCVMLSKGGVGKTALSISLGASLANAGKRVLLIDLDPQGHLTEGVGLRSAYVDQFHGLFTALSDPKGTPLASIVQEAPHDAFFVVPSSFKMMLIEQQLFLARNREHRLRELIEGNTGYDYILIDCPPALGMLSDNALNAARQVIVPVQAETTSLRALDLLLDQIESLERGLSVSVDIVAVVANLVQDSVMAETTLRELKKLPRFCPTVIKKRVLLQEAWRQGRSIYRYEPRNQREAAVKAELMEAFDLIARYIVDSSRNMSHA